MFRWVIENKLARAQRPGYTGERGIRVSKVQVDNWISDVKELGVQSIICLLADDQLNLYPDLPTDLIAYYRMAGFSVAHVPARDHQRPPLTERHLERIWEAYQNFPKPVIVHCSAGVDRTGLAIEYIMRKSQD